MVGSSSSQMIKDSAMHLYGCSVMQFNNVKVS